MNEKRLLNSFDSKLSINAMKSDLPQYSWMSLLLPLGLIAGLVLLLGFNVGGVGDQKL